MFKIKSILSKVRRARHLQPKVQPEEVVPSLPQLDLGTFVWDYSPESVAVIEDSTDQPKEVLIHKDESIKDERSMLEEELDTLQQQISAKKVELKSLQKQATEAKRKQEEEKEEGILVKVEGEYLITGDNLDGIVSWKHEELIEAAVEEAQWPLQDKCESLENDLAKTKRNMDRAIKAANRCKADLNNFRLTANETISGLQAELAEATKALVSLQDLRSSPGDPWLSVGYCTQKAANAALAKQLGTVVSEKHTLASDLDLQSRVARALKDQNKELTDALKIMEMAMQLLLQGQSPSNSPSEESPISSFSTDELKDTTWLVESRQKIMEDLIEAETMIENLERDNAKLQESETKLEAEVFRLDNNNTYLQDHNDINDRLINEIVPRYFEENEMIRQALMCCLQDQRYGAMLQTITSLLEDRSVEHNATIRWATTLAERLNELGNHNREYLELKAEHDEAVKALEAVCSVHAKCPQDPRLAGMEDCSEVLFRTRAQAAAHDEYLAAMFDCCAI